ncbi:MAG TPA: hypothetical protein VNO30_33610 [Kofleriaceae bacterium]|nr:hypothetical protein [Kofleriaceae bacterium]
MSKLGLCILTLVVVACGEVVDSDDDPCKTGTCECTVATEDTDCGAHQFCNATAAGRTCDCVAGYTDGVNGCVFTGTIQDPGLASPTAWTPANGALMNPTAVGGVDPGEASFLPSALCGLAHVKQAVTMPTFAKSEPLVLELNYKNAYDIQNGDRVLMGVSFGGNWSPFPNFFDAMFHSTRICLPEGAYAPPGTAGAGAPVTFAFGPFMTPNRCPNSTISNFAVDHAAIVAANAGECSERFGEGVNADAETTGGWTFSVTGTSSGNFVTGSGANGTRGARITLGQRCDSASVQTQINVPMVENPAFEMFVNAGPNANPTLTFTELYSTTVFTAASPVAQSRTVHMCLPPALRGQVLPLTVSQSGGSGVCADVLNLQVTVDNARVVDDPACGSTENITNPGFEQGATPWGAYGTSSYSTATATIGTATPHGGARQLTLQSLGRCSSSGYTMLPIVPAASGGAGPALKLFANVGVNADAQTSLAARGATSQMLTEGGGYRQYTVCLNPIFAGRVQPVSLSHYGGSGLCDNSNYTPQSALIDDIEVTTDPMCPAQ